MGNLWFEIREFTQSIKCTIALHYIRSTEHIGIKQINGEGNTGSIGYKINNR